MNKNKNKKVIVFAGTNEGRKICTFLAKSKIEVLAVVATEYGTLNIPNMPLIKVREGRLTLDEIFALIKPYELIIDATHPFATVISQNIKEAVKEQNKELLRIIRPAQKYDQVIECADLDTAAKILDTKKGNVFVTTGSKELLPFTKIKDYKERIFVRVLPTIEAINGCSIAGIKGTNIICMQGPFTEKMNIAIMEHIKAKFIVTKESGDSGGLTAKVTAAEKLGVKVILIGRPNQEDGLTLKQAYDYLKQKLGIEETEYSHFPLFFSLTNKKVIFVGGGKIATRRIEVLLQFGADIIVIAPEISKNILELHQEKKLKLIKREYQKEDWSEAFMVFAATNNRQINEQIYHEAKSKRIFVNVVDNKERSDFFFPGTFADEDIIGGIISKAGKDHRKVKEKIIKIKECLEQLENL